MARIGSSAYRGVSWHKKSGKWQANIYYDGKLRHLGLFTHEHQAAQAYDERAKEVWGADAQLNYPTKRSRKPAKAVSVEELTDQVLASLADRLPEDPGERREAVREAVRKLAAL